MDDKLIAGLVAVVGVVVTAILNLYWNFRKAKEERRLPFRQAQLDACLRASRAAATIATSPDLADVAASAKAFWALYYGELAIVEDRGVESAMVRFGNLLEGSDADPGKRDGLKVASLQLSHALRLLILDSWDIDLPKLEAMDDQASQTPA